MIMEGLGLLQQLLGGAGAAGKTPQSVQRQLGIEHASFKDLLQQVRDGTLSSERPVTVDPGAGISLSKEQLAQLSIAADRAEGQGVRNALVVAGDKKLLLDVKERRIVGAAPAEEGVLTGVDGVIHLDGAAGAASAGGLTAAPLMSMSGLSPDLLKLLAGAKSGT